MGPSAPALAPAARVAPETMAAAVAELDAGDGRVARLLSALGWPVTRAHQMRAAAALVAAGGRRVHVSGGYVYRRQAAP